jgi:hypothetical protein
MIEKTTRIITENLARTLDRRAFVKRTGGVVFAGLAAMASGHMVPALAGARAGQPPQPTVPSCAPPGPYCNLNGVNEPNGCHGGSCFQHLNSGTVVQCHLWYCCYQAGCWTTASGGGYWTCCDCQCSDGSTCGCAQFSGSPQPRPDGPGGGAKA